MGSDKSSASVDYALGYTNLEHERLIRQANRIAPITERLFREAGIGPGQRVLDLGSGLGDVAMLAARIVGPSGRVVGVERDATSITKARARAAAAGLHNIEFTQSDVQQISSDHPFDAAVGRFILMFLPDCPSILRSVCALVRPGGVVAFNEPTWIPFLAAASRFPLWSAVLNTIHETFLRAGVNPEMGPALYSMFQQVGLPAPNLHVEIVMGADAELISIVCDLMSSIRGLAEQHQVPLEPLGDPATLTKRVQTEVTSGNAPVMCSDGGRLGS